MVGAKVKLHPEDAPYKPLSSFVSARITFSPRPAWKYLYDQAGLVLSFRPTGSDAATPPKWIKAGIEYYEGKPQVSVVACDRWADWSVADASRGKVATIEVIRERSDSGTSLWLYYSSPDLDGGATKVPLREICWVYGESEGATGEGWEISVATCAARPSKHLAGDGEELEVDLIDFDVKWD